MNTRLRLGMMGLAFTVGCGGSNAAPHADRPSGDRASASAQIAPASELPVAATSSGEPKPPVPPPPPDGLEALLTASATCELKDVVGHRCEAAEQVKFFCLQTLEVPEPPGLLPLIVARLSAPSASERYTAAQRLIVGRIEELPLPLATELMQKVYQRLAVEDELEVAQELVWALGWLRLPAIGQTPAAWAALGATKRVEALGQARGLGFFDPTGLVAAATLASRDDAWGAAALEALADWSRDERAPAGVCDTLAQAIERDAGKRAISLSACVQVIETLLGNVAKRGRKATANHDDAKALGQLCIAAPFSLRPQIGGPVLSLSTAARDTAKLIFDNKNSTAARKAAFESRLACRGAVEQAGGEQAPDSLSALLVATTRDADPEVAEEAKRALKKYKTFERFMQRR